MKVLWITNSIFPKVSEELKTKVTYGVGWVHSAANFLIDYNKDIDLAVVSIYQGKEMKEIRKNGILHFLLPKKVRLKVNDSETESFWISIKEQFDPDIVHIHGTEYPHSYSYVKTCGSNNVVVSIQGLTSVIERYYYGSIDRLDLIKSITVRDVAKMDTILSKRKKMRKQGKYEKLLILNVNHIIGRTSWDQNHVWAINPQATYHFCNETLRPSFYQSQWALDRCEKYSIFISQAYYPLKGFHQLLKALPIVLKFYPKTKVYVAGGNSFTNRGIKINGFGNYINSMISKLKLSDHIVFTGSLSEEAMCKRFLASHLFISPSSIENSSNSIGEAQLLGVPCIASYVGGTSDMIQHGETGLMYRFEEVEMLAASICEIFSDDKLALKISEKAKIIAAKRHNKEQNAVRLHDIYLKLISKK